MASVLQNHQGSERLRNWVRCKETMTPQGSDGHRLDPESGETLLLSGHHWDNSGTWKPQACKGSMGRVPDDADLGGKNNYIFFTNH